MTSAIIYTINQSGRQQIYEHLLSTEALFIPRLSESVDIDSYSEKIRTNAVTFEAWSNELLTGLIAAYFNDTQNNIGYITNVSVLKEFQGNKIAAMLLEKCITYARLHHFQSIYLEVNKNNTGAKKLYSKYGFVQTEETEEKETHKLVIK